MDVIFDEEPPITRQIALKKNKHSLLTKIVIASGLAKTNEEAQKVLLFVAVGALLVSVCILVVIFNPPKQTLNQSEVDAEISHQAAVRARTSSH